MELKAISTEQKAYSRSLLVFGNLAVFLWIVLGAISCWFFNQLVGWLYLVSAFVLIFVVLRILGCNACYRCKSCTMGFGKLSDLFFGSGYMAGANSSVMLKMVFGYGLLGLVPISFLAVSVIQEFAVSKIAVLVLLLVILIYSGTRRRSRSQSPLAKSLSPTNPKDYSAGDICACPKTSPTPTRA
jgi:hypothetical protein